MRFAAWSAVRGPLEGVDDGLQPLALELQRRLIHDQARGNVHHVLDFDQLVGLERAAGADQVDDGVRQADQRRGGI